MKKELMILALAALMPIGSMAQDARMRTSSTIVADVLAQLPAKDSKNFSTNMKELATAGTQGVVQMAGMLVPADQGKNATIEYALSGLVAYISQQGMESEKQAVTNGLVQALSKCTNNANRAFLMTLLQQIVDKNNIQVFLDYLNDDYLGEWALNGIVAVPGTEDILLDLIKNEKLCKPKLAYAAGVKKLTAAEPILLGWLADADAKTKTAVYKALAELGTTASLETLAEGAKAINYEWEESDVTNSYVNLIYKLLEDGEKDIAFKEAKKLLKDTDKSYLHGAALKVIFAVDKKEALPYLGKALKNENRDYRVNALHLVEPYADEEVYAFVGKQLKSKKESTVQADVLNWAGRNHVASLAGLVVEKFNAQDAEIAASAIRAAGRIGGETALNGLIELLGGEHTAQATEALLAFNGKINPGIMKALDGNAAQKEAALNVIAKRRIEEATEKVFAYTKDSDSKVKNAAYKALSNVVSLKDFKRVTEMADRGENLADLQNTLKNAVKPLSAEKQLEVILPYVTTSKVPSLYYPALAQVGNERAIAEIRKGYQGNFKEEALKALLSVNNEVMINEMFEIAQTDKTNEAKVLNHYAQLVSRSKHTPIRKYQLYRKALESTSDVNVQNTMISKMGQTGTYQAFLVIAQYLDKPANKETAAHAVRGIFGRKTEEFGGQQVREVLQKTINVFKGIHNADAGYAVDDLTGKLAKVSDVAYKPLLDQAWEPVGLNPAEKAKIRGARAKKANDAAKKAADKTWQKTANGMKYVGGEKSTIGFGDYENFELVFEWKGKGKAGLGVRSIPQIDLGGENSGALSLNEANNTPAVKANNCCCEWNTVYVKVLNDRVTVKLNGQTTAANVTLENSCDRKKPAYEKGQILLIGEESPIEIREMYIKELPSTPVFTLSDEEKKAGFEVLFDGKSMHKWVGNKTNYVPVDGAILVDAQYGGNGNLYTAKEYSDFVYRFEFCFINEGVNNGVGIRTPMGVDAAYDGMEIQVLDHDAPIYKNLRVYQQHGSVYGVIPAKRVVFPERGTWNTEEIRAVGDHITVTVNGEVIVDGNIREACKGKNLRVNGQKSGTVDGLNHPGLFNKKGHIGFLGHGVGVKFRNVRILDLSKK